MIASARRLRDLLEGDREAARDTMKSGICDGKSRVTLSRLPN